MKMDQPPRFAARSKILRDRTQMLGSVVLYMLIDDIAGQSGAAWPQQSTLADSLGVSVRQVQRWLDGLVNAKYVALDRQKYRVRYVMGWSVPDTTLVSHVEIQTGHPCRSDTTPMSHLGASDLISELRQEPEILSASEILYRCNVCRDTGTKILGGQECRSCDTYLMVRRRKQEMWKRRA